MAPFLLANFLATLHFVFYLQGGLRPPYRYGTKSELSGIAFCILLIGGTSNPVKVRYRMQCSQKVGQKKWSQL